MVYLNGLNLQHNQLSGQIREQFSGLARLTSFNVADNLLSGTIPSTLQKFPASTFASNRGLCDAPLDECPSRKTKRRLMIHDESVIGAAVGFAVGFVAAFTWLLLLHPNCFEFMSLILFM
ncbi:hypothetical protein SEVIR_5G415832v4 [Setaria viridis]|uniref:Leucine-rich repeat-containing N-terminal plant-type domain-containing protein n=1 Tax=Setaria viridis TaxID=4556 RepID=A0A4U6UVG3_SETVI|nr:hypothetical protein SEVIR_5G415832v2 [Setaria viridis]